MKQHKKIVARAHKEDMRCKDKKEIWIAILVAGCEITFSLFPLTIRALPGFYVFVCVQLCLLMFEEIIFE
jgi:hypothetical protein